jgi:BirA family transcriptional regulator, biotin operon repressor / biotin---[acetyl-CoA-carboxylase] ligase
LKPPGFDTFVSELRQHSRGCGWNLVVVRRVDSSNRLARRVSREFTVEGLQVPAAAIVAFEQTAGRGRLGRSWASPPGGGVYASLLLPAPPAEELAALPMAIPLALCTVLDRHLPRPCLLKWPNDLLVGGRKIAGVLVETSLRPSGGGEVIVGFGVNHATPARQLVSGGATSVGRESECPPPLGILAWQLVTSVAEALRHPAATPVVARRYFERSAHRRGERLRCQLPGRFLDGNYLGLTDEGFLRLEVDGQEEVVSAGEVVER